ncbi:hypothetical protein [Streptomyces sp. NPDC056255]|uniref:hypothetical protein n=1 Tax=Streptomyces sp. NPDC056255 TaxID=3345764 RepID=UPI0035DB3CCA
MKLYLAVPAVLLALLIAASGVAAFSRGWVLPVNRRPVCHPHLYGWGQFVVAFALCRQMAFLLVPGNPDSSQWGTLTGSALLLTGLIVMKVSHRMGHDSAG